MSVRKPLLALALIGLLLVGGVAPAVAHETRTVEGYEITFGGAEEPLITGERIWLEFEIVDNETGEPVANRSENLTVSVQTSGSEKTPLEFGEKRGEPGAYEAPVVFTEPGEYVVHLEGSLEDTEVHTHFETDVQDRTELEYPGNDSQTDTSTESETADTRTEEAGFGSVAVAIAATVPAAGSARSACVGDGNPPRRRSPISGLVRAGS